MKRKLLTAFALFTAGTAFCQHKQQPATVADWSRIAGVLTPRWWPHVKDQVSDQVTADDARRLAAYNPWEKNPPEMSSYHMVYIKGMDSLKFIENMNRLKCYHIATYTNSLNPKNVREMVILKVPYEDNRHWNDSVRWDVLYFVLDKKYMRLNP